MVAAEPEALRARYEAVREPLVRALEGLTDEQVLEPSLDGWSVKDHLGHLTVRDEIRGAGGRANAPG